MFALSQFWCKTAPLWIAEKESVCIKNIGNHPEREGKVWLNPTPTVWSLKPEPKSQFHTFLNDMGKLLCFSLTVSSSLKWGKLCKYYLIVLLWWLSRLIYAKHLESTEDTKGYNVSHFCSLKFLLSILSSLWHQLTGFYFHLPKRPLCIVLGLFPRLHLHYKPQPITVH